MEPRPTGRTTPDGPGQHRTHLPHLAQHELWELKATPPTEPQPLEAPFLWAGPTILGGFSSDSIKRPHSVPLF